ncbi:MAG: hypothetical protein IMX02_13625 [Limnochordaceae bacterium]|nr:hypothetical protein [Limnochordaceae bacterium]
MGVDPLSWRPSGETAARFLGIVRQSEDHSCGYAAVATVLASLGHPVSERELMDGTGPGARLRPASVADLIRVFERHGVRAHAVRSSWEQLRSYFARFTRPAVALVDHRRRHFTVLLAADADAVYLADPSLGHQVLSPARFQAGWTGVLVLVDPDGRLGSSGPGSETAVAEALRQMRQRHRLLMRWPVGDGWAGGGR